VDAYERGLRAEIANVQLERERDEALAENEYMLRMLCEALGEQYEFPSDNPSEPPYRMDWPRILGTVRGRTRVWSDLMKRAEEVDAEWLREYRGRSSRTRRD